MTNEENRRTPLRGAWIEIIPVAKNQMEPGGVAPRLGVRGLKCRCVPRRVAGVQASRTPLRGAWIEIPRIRPLHLCNAAVAPRLGVRGLK